MIGWFFNLKPLLSFPFIKKIDRLSPSLIYTSEFILELGVATSLNMMREVVAKDEEMGKEELSSWHTIRTADLGCSTGPTTSHGLPPTGFPRLLQRPGGQWLQHSSSPCPPPILPGRRSRLFLRPPLPWGLPPFGLLLLHSPLALPNAWGSEGQGLAGVEQGEDLPERGPSGDGTSLCRAVHRGHEQVLEFESAGGYRRRLRGPGVLVQCLRSCTRGYSHGKGTRYGRLYSHGDGSGAIVYPPPLFF